MPAPTITMRLPAPSRTGSSYAGSRPTPGLSAHSPLLPTLALVMKELMQCRQPMQRRICPGRPSSIFLTQCGSQMKERAEPMKS